MYAIQGNFEIAGILVIIGIVFDFFDGFAARLLGISGELGKQLDSLADMVTSGVVPGVIMFYLLSRNELGVEILVQPLAIANFIPFLGLLLTLGAGYRLAKFNIDTRQTNSFIGLPTPAMSLFVISLPLIIEYSEIEFVNNIINNVYFLIGVTVALTYFMNAELPLFSLKFKGYALKTNSVQYVFILISLFLILSLNVISIPIIIILYILTSIIQNYYKPK
jgi:CDP-diacylglycerol--serine O-phosphatidyltransferase